MKKLKRPIFFILATLFLLSVFHFFIRSSEPLDLRTDIYRIELFNHTTGMRYILESEDMEALLDSLRFYRASRVTAYIAPVLSPLSAHGIYSFTVLDHENRVIGRILRGGNVLEINHVRYHFWAGREIAEIAKNIIPPNSQNKHNP